MLLFLFTFFQDDFKKLWDIQNSLIGQFEVIQPGRVSYFILLWNMKIFQW